MNKKKMIFLMVSIGLMFVFLCGCSNQKVSNKAHNLSFQNIKEITDEIVTQKDVMGEFVEMSEQENVKKLEFQDSMYLVPVNTEGDKASVFVKSRAGKIYKYNVYKQNAPYDTYEKYMAYHGCSACALTTLLNATVPELSDYTPDRVVSEIQKETFGEEVFRKNFKKKMVSQMPVTMYGITQILEKYDVEHRFVYNFTNELAITEITEHLKEGKPVVITLRRKNGNKKWAGTVHTLLLIGLDEEGNAIVCDSANKKWAGVNQRVKFGKVEELVKFMWSSTELSTSSYYSGRKGTSGYILVY